MHQDADRNLLLGLLALQAGLIDQAQLVAAFRAWTADKARPIVDHLISLGHLDQTQRAAIAALASIHDADLERGLTSASISESTRAGLTCLNDPDLDATLTRTGRSSTASYPEPPGADHADPPGSGGRRFQVLRPHARGGLGVVFVALDSELHREVALKRILEHHADDSVSRSRFLIEAEITGGLEHPGIVPVYGFGTHDDGRPYYAMRFIRGESLREAINTFHKARKSESERSLEFRRLLRKFTDVCNAIEYAHSRGVVHRDIKPGNVIVGKHGETLVVDWGLAKALGKSATEDGEWALVPMSAESSSATRPGQALGTPAYMSPEQAQGDLDRVGPRSDVYSLGATLYCLLVGKAPFGGQHQAAVLKAVELGNFPRPRAVNPATDPALEAVVLKAMARDPTERYGSARALADDVDRWLADERVEAYPEPWARSLNRWLSRHRTGVTSVAAAGIMALVGLGIVSVVQTRANQALAASNQALDRQRRRAEANESQAITAVKRFADAIADNPELKNNSELDSLRKALLQEPLSFFGQLRERLQADGDTRPESLARLADVIQDHADLAREIGNPGDSLRAHADALAILERLVRDHPAVLEYQADLARGQNNLGVLLSNVGRGEEALAAHERAVAIWGRLADADPGTPEYRAGLIDSRLNIGNLLNDAGRSGEALAAHQRAVVIGERLTRDHPDVAKYQTDLASGYNNLGLVLGRLGRNDEVLAAYKRATTIGEQLVHDHPDAAKYQADLMNTLTNHGYQFRHASRLAEALATLKRAVEVGERLVRDHPTVTQYRAGLANSHNNLGTVLSDVGRNEEALTAHRRALAIEERLVSDHPDVTGYRVDLARNHLNLGVELKHMGQHDEALEAYKRSVAIRERLVSDYPEVRDYQANLANSYQNIGVLLSDMSQPDEALIEYGRSLAIRERLVRDHPDTPDYQADLMISHHNLGGLFKDAGRIEEALEAYKRAITIGEQLAGNHPDVASYEAVVARSHGSIGSLLASAGRNDEALAAFERTIAIRERLTRDHPDVAEYPAGLAQSHGNRGRLLEAIGRPNEAAEAYERARGLAERLVHDHPEDPAHAVSLSRSLTSLALLDLADSRFAEARDRFVEAIGWLKKARGDGFQNPSARNVLDGLLTSLIQAERGLGHADEAARVERELAEFRRDSPEFEALDARLKAVMGGGQPQDDAERLALGKHAFDVRRFGDAARLWGDALDNDPSLADDRLIQLPYNAACVAALAADGQGADPPGDDVEKARLRGKALGWLKSELAVWSKSPDSAQPQGREEVVQTLQHWREDTDLASVRDPDALSKLPEAERTAWHALWGEAEALLKRASTP